MATSSLGPAHHPSPAALGADLAIFDGFPYLVTRVVPTMYHFILLPGDASEHDLVGFAQTQWRANRLDLCMVSQRDRALYISASGEDRWEATPPMGGVPIADRLRPSATWPDSPELHGRRQQLERFIAARVPKAGAMLGDLTKGAHEATADELARLAGGGTGDTPRGVKPCPICGEWRGQCLDPSPTFFCRVVAVHCRCENHNRCAACGQQLYERRLNANYYNQVDRQIWHVPGFCGLGHQCPPTSEVGGIDATSGVR